MDSVVRIAVGDPFLQDRVMGDLTSWSLQEEATPIAPGDSSGSTSQITVSGIGGDRALLCNGATLEITDNKLGTARGIVTGGTRSSRNVVTLTADSLVQRLNVDMVVPPYFAAIGDVTNDAFTRANSATSLGLTPNKHTYIALSSSVWGISSNQAYVASGTTPAVAVTTALRPDHEITAQITAIGAGGTVYAGVCARLTAFNSYYFADFNSAGVWRLGKFVEGAYTLFATGGGSAVNDIIKLRCYGNAITFFRNGTQMATVTDASLRGTFSGMVSAGSTGSTASRWDNLSITLVNSMGTADGNLYNSFCYYMSLVGIDSADVIIDPEIRYDQVVFPGFVGNLWDHMKQMCSALGYQIYSTGTQIGLTKPNKVTIEISEPDGDNAISFDPVERTQSIQINNYNLTRTTQGIFFKSTDVYSLNAGERQEVTVQVMGTPSTLNNPVAVDGMDLRATSGVGQYVVTGDDGYIIAPQLWRDLGGYITARVDPEQADQIIITLKAPADDSRAPYRISEGDDRPALWITGSGVLSSAEVVRIWTGDGGAPTEMLDPIDNKFVATKAMAYTAGMRAAQQYAQPTVRLSISGIPNIILTAKAYSYVVPPYGSVFSTVDTEITSWYGSVAGAILTYGSSKYRVLSATFEPNSLSMDLAQYVTFDDFNKVWAGKTFADYQTATGTLMTFSQQAIFPLTTSGS